MRNLILFILSTLAFLMHPLSLSAQNSFSLSLDVNSSAGDQAVTSLNTSPDQVIAIQIFGKDIQNATGVSVRFEYDAGQVVYEGFDAGNALPSAQALIEQGTAYVEIGLVSFGGQATDNSGLVGTIRFRTLTAFSSSAIRLVRGELARSGQIESMDLNLRVELQPELPKSFALSLDVNDSVGDQGVTSATVPEDEVVAVQIFGEDMEGATGLVARFEYDAAQVSYEGFDAGTVLPNAQVTHQQGSAYVEITLTSSGQATDNSGLVGTIRFRTLTAFSSSAVRLVRADLTRSGQSQSMALNLRIALQKAFPTSFSLSLDVNDSSGDQGVTSATVPEDEVVAVQIFGDDMEGATGLVTRFEYDAAQVSYEGFDAGSVLPNAQVTHQQGSDFVEISLTFSGQATFNSGLLGTIRFRTLTAFSGSAVRLARADLARGGQSQSRTLNLQVALQRALPTSFSLSLDVNRAGGDQGVTSAIVSADEGVAIQVFGEDLLGATDVSLRFEYDAAQVVYEGFDAGSVLPNAQATRQQGSNFVEISITSSSQATVNSGLLGTIRFRTLTAFSGSAVRLARADLVRGGQSQSSTLNLRVALQRALPTSFSMSLDGNRASGNQAVTSATVSADGVVAIQVFGEDLLGATGVSVRFEYDANQVAYESFDAGNVLPNAQVGRQQGSNFVEVSLTSSGQATFNSGLVGTIRFRTLSAFSGSAIRLVRADLVRGGQTQSRTLNLQVALQRALPTSFSLSLDVNRSSGNQAVTSAIVSADGVVAIQVFGEDLWGATGVSVRFEYDATQVAYERFDAGSVLPNAQVGRQGGSTFVEISLTSSGQATVNSGLIGTIRFRTLTAFSSSAVRLVRADLVRGGQTQSRTLNLQVALQRALPQSFSLSLDVNDSSGDQAVTSATVSEDEVISVQIFGEDIQGATDITVRFEYDGGQVVYDSFDTGTVLPNAQATRQQGSTFVEISIASSGQATVNSGLVGTIRFRTLTAFSGSAIRLARADLVRGGQSRSMALNLRVALQKALSTSFSLSLDMNSSSGNQGVTSAIVSAGEDVVIQVFGTDIQNATGVSVRFEYDASQVVYESFDAGSALPNVQVLTEQGTGPTFVEIGLVSFGGQATVNSGLIGAIRFRTLSTFSGSAIRLVRADLVRGRQIQSVPLNLRVELQLSISTAPSPDFDGDGVVGIPDFLLFVDAFGYQEGQVGYESKYDLDGNGTIGIPDFLIFVDNFGKDVSTPSGGSGGSGGDSGSGAMQVAIPDANLRAVIENILDKVSGAPITRAEMAILTTGFRARDANIKDLTGLEFAINLEQLNLGSNSISDVSALSGLTSLERLNLNFNSISDVSALSGLTRLRTLQLQINNISDVSAFSGLTSLERLDLAGNAISDVSALSGLTSLIELYLQINSISDVSALSNLTRLTELYLGSNSISDVSVLSNLTSLIDLSLYSNSISDVSALSNLTNLIDLSLSDNSISDISVLSNLTGLRILNLGSNSISDVSALSNLTSLTGLYLSNNNISDVSVLSNLTRLETLKVSNNNISDVSVLSNLTSLESLSLYSNSISDVSVLSNLTSLEILNVFDNSISDISVLSGLTSLGILYLYANNISDLAPLVANTGLGSGDLIDVHNNPLSAISINTHIPALQSRGVDVRFGASKPAVAK